MLARISRTIRRQALFTGSDATGVLCAVSGGPDSMALLACLWELSPRLGLRLEVATVDHGLRPEATDEIALVAARAEALGLPWHPLRVDVKGARLSAAGGGGRRAGGVQEVARGLRLAALADLAARRGLGRVALGHQADDQAETVLFRILRGTGVPGLAGIPYRRGPYVRPMLDVTRAEVLRYLARRSLPFVTDRSNADLRYSRARLRHQILPLLRRENPRLDQALRSLAASAAAHTAEDEADPSRRIASAARAAGAHVPLRLVAEIAAVAREGRGARSYDLADRRRVTVVYGRVHIGGPRPARVPSTTATATAASAAAGLVISIPGPGSYVFRQGWAIAVREEAASARIASAPAPAHRTMPDDGGWVWFDGDRLSWPLGARNRRPGDRMRPRGGVGSRKLADLLIDAKVPEPERAALPVVTSADGKLLFVPGLRPAEGADPSDSTRRWIGLAVVANSNHDALVDPSVGGGNTETDRLLKRFAAKSMRR